MEICEGRAVYWDIGGERIRTHTKLVHAEGDSCPACDALDLAEAQSERADEEKERADTAEKRAEDAEAAAVVASI